MPNQLSKPAIPTAAAPAHWRFHFSFIYLFHFFSLRLALQGPFPLPFPTFLVRQSSPAVCLPADQLCSYLPFLSVELDSFSRTHLKHLRSPFLNTIHLPSAGRCQLFFYSQGIYTLGLCWDSHIQERKILAIEVDRGWLTRAGMDSLMRPLAITL